jgi:dTMP kinase
MSRATSRGAFILFEGIDRCGKSTQVSMLSKELAASTKVESIRFPNRESNICQLINSYLSSASDLNDQTIHLLFSANRWESSKEIERKLAEGITLVGYQCVDF